MSNSLRDISQGSDPISRQKSQRAPLLPGVPFAKLLTASPRGLEPLASWAATKCTCNDYRLAPLWIPRSLDGHRGYNTCPHTMAWNA